MNIIANRIRFSKAVRTAVFALSMAAVGCDDGTAEHSVQGINDLETVELTHSSTVERTFHATEDWVLTYSYPADTAWCRVSPLSGGRGTHTIRFSTTATPTRHDRYIGLRISSGMSRNSITVHLRSPEKLVLGENRFMIPASGKDLAVSLCDGAELSSVSDGLQEWCTFQMQPSDKGTCCALSVKPSLQACDRQGWMAFVSGDVSDTLFVHQQAEAHYALLTGESRSLSEICREHTLTKVVVDSYDYPQLIQGMSPEQMDLHSRYRDKGMALVYLTEYVDFIGKDARGARPVQTRDECVSDFIRYNYADREGVYWLKGAEVFEYGKCYYFDSDGRMVASAPLDARQGDTSLTQESRFLQERLGNPASLQSCFRFRHYTSTDYSREGESFLIQRATVGRGINLVLVGEGFTDRDMAQGGVYEQRLAKSAEQLFEVEPMRSLRSRFNIYGVKAVSPNGIFAGDAVQRINLNVGNAFQYAAQLFDGNEPQLHVAVIYNTEQAVGRSCCHMLADGSFAAFVMGPKTGILSHEVTGHGFGKLLDEYVEFEQLDEYEMEDIRKGKVDGRYSNVDLTDNPLQVKWAHFLQDPRYKNESLGVFEGGATAAKGVYRPSLNSIMHTNEYLYFNAPSREAIYREVMALSEGKDWKFDYETFVRFDMQSYGAAPVARSARSAGPDTEQDNEGESDLHWIPQTWKTLLDRH